MSEAQYTPGRWSPELGEAYSVRSEDGGRICTLNFLKGRGGLGGRRNANEVAFNARLIAAAPELLEACKAAKEALRMCYDVCDYPANGRTEQDKAIQSLAAAIAKAEDQESDEQEGE